MGPNDNESSALVKIMVPWYSMHVVHVLFFCVFCVYETAYTPYQLFFLFAHILCGPVGVGVGWDGGGMVVGGSSFNWLD